jgi:metal-responsive CopG/Arc/MetJ family transcriptional regulator
MVRTQVYLTESERKGLSAVSERSGRKTSELIREAVDRYLSSFQEENRLDVCNRVSGIWSDREEKFTAAALRESWERDGEER